MPSPIKILDATYEFTLGEGEDAIAIFEGTTNVTDGLHLFRPDGRCVELFDGVIGRNQVLYDYQLFAYHALSTHVHWLIGVRAVDLKASVMQHLNSNIAREINTLRERTGPLWLRPNRPIQVTDEAHLEQRLAYIMLQAVAANVVSKAALTPFASANPHLLEGKKIKGAWVDRTAMCTFRERTGRTANEDDFTTWYPVRIDKLPHLRHLSDAEYRNVCRDLVREAELTAERQRKAGERTFTGAAKARALPPQHQTPYRVRKKKKSPAPVLHGSPAQERAFRGRYAALLEAVRAATESWREFLAGVIDAPLRYPEGTQPPGNLRGCVARYEAPGAPAPT